MVETLVLQTLNLANTETLRSTGQKKFFSLFYTGGNGFCIFFRVFCTLLANFSRIELFRNQSFQKSKISKSKFQESEMSLFAHFPRIFVQIDPPPPCAAGGQPRQQPADVGRPAGPPRCLPLHRPPLQQSAAGARDPAGEVHPPRHPDPKACLLSLGVACLCHGVQRSVQTPSFLMKVCTPLFPKCALSPPKWAVSGESLSYPSIFLLFPVWHRRQAVFGVYPGCKSKPLWGAPHLGWV